MTLPVEDRIALRELVDAYAMAVDALDVEWFGSLWAPDAVLAVHDAGGEVRRWQGDEIGGMLAGVRRYLRTFHFVGNHRTVMEAGVVSGQTYCFAHHLHRTDHESDHPGGGSAGPARDRVVAIRYDDGYHQADDGRWRFSRRDVRILWRMHHDVELVGDAT